jgi:Ctr copper transporter family
VHGSRTRGDGSLVLVLPSSYDSTAAVKAAVAITLRCVAPSCLALAGNGFMLVPSAGSLVPALPGGWSQPVAPGSCGSAQTHTQSLAMADFPFLWTPPAVDPDTGLGGGTVTFNAAVVAAVPQVSYIVTGCVPDIGSGSSSSSDGAHAPTDTSMAGMSMRRRRRLAQSVDASDNMYGTPPPSSSGSTPAMIEWRDNTTVCDASAPHGRRPVHRPHTMMMMAGTLWAQNPTEWSMPAVLYNARIHTTGNLLLLLTLSTMLAAATPVLGAWLTSKHRMRVAAAEVAAAAAFSAVTDDAGRLTIPMSQRPPLLLQFLSLPPLLRACRAYGTRVAGDVVLVAVYEAASYGCMLLAMTFNAYVIAALSFGAGVAFLALRMA